MWELDYKESWVPKNWCFRTVVLEKTLESPSDCKGIQLVHPKGNQSWIFTGRTDAEAETPIVWPPDVEELTHWESPWYWERLKAGEGRPGVLPSVESQTVGQDWVTELIYLPITNNLEIIFTKYMLWTFWLYRFKCIYSIVLGGKALDNVRIFYFRLSNRCILVWICLVLHPFINIFISVKIKSNLIYYCFDLFFFDY